MRAVLLDKKIDVNDVGKEISLDGDSARHLIKVIRIKKFERVLLLNGNGCKAEVEVVHVDRKVLALKVISSEEVEDKRRLNLFLGLPKKEAFESIVKMASEIGIKNIFLYRSDYSQQSLEVNERLLRIEESAIVQSNNPFKINFIIVSSFEEVFTRFENIIHFSTFSNSQLKNDSIVGDVLMVIGPEAGFSEDEEVSINGMSNVSVINLETNIMRAPTALAVASGYILKSF